MTETPDHPALVLEHGRRRWLKRLGVAGFMFFLIKGLLWLLVPAGIVLWRSMSGE